MSEATTDTIGIATGPRQSNFALELLPSRGVRLFAVVAMAGIGVHAIGAVADLGDGTVHQLVYDWLYCSLYAVAVAACLAHARAGQGRAAWLTAAAGVSFWGGAEVLFRVLEPDPHAWYPWASQALLAIAFTLAYLTLVLLARARVRRFDTVQVLDGAVAAFSTTAVASLLLFPAGGVDTDQKLPGVFLLAALMGLAFVLAVHALAGWRPDRLWDLVTLAIAINALGDVLLVHAGAHGDFRRGSLADTLFVSSALLLAFAGFYAGRGGRGLLARAFGLPLPLGFAAAAISVLVLAGVGEVSTLPVVLAGIALVVTLARLAVALRLVERSRLQAMTDGLTGLGNRRKLIQDLSQELSTPEPRPLTLALFDLDGFKAYNDTFGHPSGDALLALFADRLARAVAPGRAYRMGGDEFCALLDDSRPDASEALRRASTALRQAGDGFAVTTSFGAVALHSEATDVSSALRLADARMYEIKAMGRQLEHHGTRNALLQVLGERQPAVRDRAARVAALARAVAARVGLDARGVELVGRAAELHDIGKMAVPVDILGRAGPLDAEEWRVVRQHTLVGERILRAAPSLADAAPLVRSSHEHWDGGGYPDGLSGEDIPIGARIIASCDAYVAMTSARQYAGRHSVEAALAELHRRAGEQFDPAVVDALSEEVATERVAFEED